MRQPSRKKLTMNILLTKTHPTVHIQGLSDIIQWRKVQKGRFFAITHRQTHTRTKFQNFPSKCQNCGNPRQKPQKLFSCMIDSISTKCILVPISLLIQTVMVQTGMLITYTTLLLQNTGWLNIDIKKEGKENKNWYSSFCPHLYSPSTQPKGCHASPFSPQSTEQ